jgi:hypothetical protein
MTLTTTTFVSVDGVMVASMFAGLAEATRSGKRFEQLAREHATRGGINQQFLNVLEQSEPSSASASACNASSTG